MSKKQNTSHYCRMREINKNCSILTYNKDKICSSCRYELVKLAGKIELIKELNIQPEKLYE